MTVDDPPVLVMRTPSAPAASFTPSPVTCRRQARMSRSMRWRPLTVSLSDAMVLTIAILVYAVPGEGRWSALFAVVTIVGLAATGQYGVLHRPSLGKRVGGAIAVSAVATLVIATLRAIESGADVSLNAVSAVWLASAAGLIAVRGLHELTHLRESTSGAGVRRVLIVGTGEASRLAAHRLTQRPGLGMRPVGFLDADPLEQPVLGLEVLGDSRDLDQVVRDNRIDTILIGSSSDPDPVLLALARRGSELGIEVMMIPRLFGIVGTQTATRHIGALPLTTLSPAPDAGAMLSAKYACDRILAAAMLVATLPLLLVLALLVKLTSKGPILHRAQRVGKDGEPFEMLKLRTMFGSTATRGETHTDWALRSIRLGEEGIAGLPASNQWEIEDLRTPIGRVLRPTSLDELPQLWNVVRGEMSLVGPRPEIVAYVELFSPTIDRYEQRHRVRPGLTGWAQVQGLRGETSLRDRVEWDNFYIENWSPWFDLKIIMLTVVAVCKREEEAHPPQRAVVHQ